MIIPYNEVNITTDDYLIPVKSVTIGPTEHQQLSKLSVKSLLESTGFERFSISLSRIPYRGW